MNYLSRLLISTSVSTLLLTALPAQAQSIESLGDLPGGLMSSRAYGISADGSVAVGAASSSNGLEAFRWTSGGGMVGLGDLAGGSFYSFTYGASSDGSVVVGESESASGNEAFRWTSGGGMVGLGDLAGGGFNSVAYGVNSDGSIIVGLGNSASGQEAFRWTSGGGMVGLGDLAGGAFNSAARGINSDGSVIVGVGFSASGNEAFRWTSGGGMVGLGDLAGGGFLSVARGVSADGSVVVGEGLSASGFEAFRWTSGGGMVSLGDLAGGSFYSSAFATNSDGSVVVGESDSASGYDAFRWTQATGIQSLTELLTTAGVDLTGYALSSARGVDSTGNIIVGEGPFGTSAFLVNLATSGMTTLDNLATGLASGVVPVQQVQSAASSSIGQSLFAATQSSALFGHNGLSVFNSNVSNNNLSPSMIAPAAGDEEGAGGWWSRFEQGIERPYAAYAVGTFGIGQDNDTDNITLNGTTGLMVKLTDAWTMGLGVIGSHNRSDMAYDGESILKAVGGSVITSYESQESGLRLYGSAFAAHLDVETDRQYLNGAGIDVSHGSTSGMGYGIAVRGGWEFNAIADTRIMPYGEIQVTKIQLDGYTETDGSFPAAYGSSNGVQVTTKLGTQISYDVTPTITMATRLAWAYRLREDDDGISASSTGFSATIGNPSGDKNWGELSIEAGWQATEATRFSAELSGRSGRTQDPAGSITVGLSTRF